MAFLFVSHACLALAVFQLNFIMVSLPEKSLLRRQLRQRRRQISLQQRQQAQKQLVTVARRARLLRRGWDYGAYWPMPEECPVQMLLQTLQALNARVWLPQLPPRGQRRLRFCAWTGAGRWQRKRFGLHQWHGRYFRAVQRLRCVWVPLVGFDHKGQRLGMGGGFYDVSLAPIVRRRCWLRPYRIGVAFEEQAVAQIPCDPWDVALDGVLTPHRFIRCGRFGRAIGQQF